MEEIYKRYKKYSTRAKLYLNIVTWTLLFINVFIFLLLSEYNMHDNRPEIIGAGIVISVVSSIIIMGFYMLFAINKGLDKFTDTIASRILFSKKTTYKGLNFYIIDNRIYGYFGDHNVAINDGLIDSNKMDILINRIVRMADDMEVIKSKKKIKYI